MKVGLIRNPSVQQYSSFVCSLIFRHGSVCLIQHIFMPDPLPDSNPSRNLCLLLVLNQRSFACLENVLDTTLLTPYINTHNQLDQEELLLAQRSQKPKGLKGLRVFFMTNSKWTGSCRVLFCSHEHSKRFIQLTSFIRYQDGELRLRERKHVYSINSTIKSFTEKNASGNPSSKDLINKF